MPTFTATQHHGVKLSDALREAAMHAPATGVVYYTYEFVHSSFTSRALIVVDHNNLEAYDENGVLCTFIALAGLKSEGPEESDNMASAAIRLRLDGVSSELLDDMNLALTSLDPTYVIERIYIAGDLSGPAVIPPVRATIRSGEVSETTIELEAGFGDPSNQPFPRKLYTRKEHPGLVQ